MEHLLWHMHIFFEFFFHSSAWACKSGFFFFCEMGPNWDHRTQARWLIALYLSFKFIGGYLGIQPPYRGPQYCSASPLLFVLDPSRQSPRSASLPFPTPSIRIEYVPIFPFLHRISCMRESKLSSSCAAFTADWYSCLGALPTFCNVSCPVYLWTERTYQLVPSDTVGWSHTFHRLFVLSVSFLYVFISFTFQGWIHIDHFVLGEHRER